MRVEEIGEKKRRFSPGGGPLVAVGIPGVTNKSQFKGASPPVCVIVIPLSPSTGIHEENPVPNIGSPLLDSASVASSCSASQYSNLWAIQLHGERRGLVHRPAGNCSASAEPDSIPYDVFYAPAGDQLLDAGDVPPYRLT